MARHPQLLPPPPLPCTISWTALPRRPASSFPFVLLARSPSPIGVPLVLIVQHQRHPAASFGVTSSRRAAMQQQRPPRPSLAFDSCSMPRPRLHVPVDAMFFFGDLSRTKICQDPQILGRAKFRLKMFNFIRCGFRQVPRRPEPSDTLSLTTLRDEERQVPLQKRTCTTTSGGIGSVKSNNDCVQLLATSNDYET
ncbi:hypothetical protein TRIUR3_26503 [Triticum urartu]|uniref:Uncharacterized protein n=1 Tax=Triticum urartu TaxID=4572 RepID=M7Z325_TRIUA|nr:hypothetical protein TRIUR3_26503 [Triticum urartu]